MLNKYYLATNDEEEGEFSGQYFFELSVKKMYWEFTKESRTGGGGLSVQDGLRLAQNCFIELLSLDLKAAYQFGFLYLRQLLLHLRNVRNNTAKEAAK